MSSVFRTTPTAEAHTQSPQSRIRRQCRTVWGGQGRWSWLLKVVTSTIVIIDATGAFSLALWFPRPRSWEAFSDYNFFLQIFVPYIKEGTPVYGSLIAVSSGTKLCAVRVSSRHSLWDRTTSLNTFFAFVLTGMHNWPDSPISSCAGRISATK